MGVTYKGFSGVRIPCCLLRRILRDVELATEQLMELVEE